MKVLFITRKFPPSVGGMEKFAFELSDALAKNKELELRIISWGGSNKWLPLVMPLHFFRSFWYLITHPQTDIIHAQDGVVSIIGWILSKIFNKPYVVVVHGLDITHKSSIYQKLITPFIKKANHVVSISSATRKEVENRGSLPSRVSVITPGVNGGDLGLEEIADRSIFNKSLGLKSDDDRPVLITTGRLVTRKGVEWFIRMVLPELVERNPDLLYLVAGEGAERNKIERAIIENKLFKQVKLLGRVNDSLRKLIYDNSDLFIMPNIVVEGDIEGFGLVAHEASLAELPVVASGIGGIKDAIVDGKNGKLLQPENAKAFVETIDTFIKDTKLRKEFGREAKEFTLKEFAWDKIAQQYLDIYKNLKKS